MNKIYTGLLCLILMSASTGLQAQTVETVVGWTTWFNFTDNTADQGIVANKQVTALTATGGAGPVTFSDVDGNGTSHRAFAAGWSGGMNTKAWQFQFSTLKYNTLLYSCKLSGTNSPNNYFGPRDFQLQYSLNGTTWVNVTGGALQAGNGYNTFNSLNNIALPAACNNQATVYLRMLMTSNTSVTGTGNSAGQSHLDDLLVTGGSIPEAPSDIKLTNGTLLLSDATGSAASASTLGTFSSVDFNLGNTFTYSLVTGTGSTSNTSFSLAGTSLSTTTALARGEYPIRIRSTDNAGLFFEKNFIIRVVAPDVINVGSRQRISNMGPDGNIAYAAISPANLAYNSTNNEFLSVWQGDDNTAPLVDNEYEVFAQRINAATGAATGGRVRVSFMGTNGVANSSKGQNPSVAYNATDDEYFVVWQGDPTVAGDEEIYGQRLNATTGVLVGTAIRLSVMGIEGSNLYKAQTPDVAWNAINNQYLVVWRGDDNTAPLVDNENEVFGQLVSNTGTLAGSRVRISNMGTSGDVNFAASLPSVSYNQADNKYLVVWRSDDNTAPMVDNDFEVFGQILTNTAALSGARIRISTMGADGVSTFTANAPDVAWNSTDNAFFVVWSGDDNTGGLVDNEVEIYGQRIASSGAFLGTRIRLSDMGPDGVSTFNAANPKVAYNKSLNEYWVLWAGDDDFTSIDNETEIFMQRVSGLGIETGINDNRISFMGPVANAAFTVSQPAIAYSPSNFSALAIWVGDDNTAPLVDNETEVFAQSLFVNSSLPVTWIDFTASLQDNGTALLRWQTAAEVNSKSFIIQRSTTATAWVDIGKVAAAGNFSAVSDYRFVDGKPTVGKNYYRLQQVDADGALTTSKIVLLENGQRTGFTLFPNPATSHLSVELPTTGAASVRILSQQGQLIMSRRLAGQDQVIDISALRVGVYYLQVLQGGKSFHRIFLKK